MKKGIFRSKSAFSVVEALLSSALLGLLFMIFVGAMLYGQESTALAGTHARAVFMAEEGIEAVKNIRDDDFANLIDGTYGLAIVGNQWTLSGSSDINGPFTRSITVSTVDANTKNITTNITWQQNLQRSGSISMQTQLTHWQAVSGTQASDLNVNIDNANIGGGGNRNLRGIRIENTGAADITIDKITVEWTNGTLIEHIRIDGGNVWAHNTSTTPAGKQPTGTELDIDDFLLSVGSGLININRFRFDGNMTGDTFTITFTMADASTKQVIVDFGPSCGTQASTLVTGTGSAVIGGTGNSELQGITVQNTDPSCDITIDKITTTWDNAQLIEEISINATTFWKHDTTGTPSGKQSSGTELDGVDYVLQQSAGVTDINFFKFDGDMTGRIFTITFTMGDGSTKVETVDLSVPVCGTESSTLVVDSSGAFIGGAGNRQLLGITIENTDAACTITIDKMTLTWTNTRRITEIEINSGDVWKHNGVGTPNGRQLSGTELDIVDYALGPSSGAISINKIRFNGNMTGVVFDITFTMADASTKTVSNITP